MSTVCIPKKAMYQGLGGRRVESGFDGGAISSDAGLLLAREAANRLSLFEELASCFRDHRDPRRVQHPVRQLLAQRILGLVAGYEDLNDHADLRFDPLFAAACDRREPDEALASSSTLNRLEHGSHDAVRSRYQRITWDEQAIADLLVDLAVQRFEAQPERIILDFDATDDRVHGHQEGRFFHGYYGHYCYLPLYVFWDDFPMAAVLRKADQDGAAGCLDELRRVVAGLRDRWPEVDIWVRGDSGFCRDWLMDWCENNGVHYVLGLARNSRLKAAISDELVEATERSEETGEPARIFKELRYRTLDSWSCERRVVAKAEHIVGKDNPRFVVTSLSVEDFDAREVYEDLYAVRGDMENRIKEQQLGLFADRTSAATMRANQLRLWFSTFAYVVYTEFRRVGLAGTELARAQVSTIRRRLIKIGAVIRISVRRLYASMSSAFPLKSTFTTALQQLQEAPRTPRWG